MKFLELFYCFGRAAILVLRYKYRKAILQYTANFIIRQLFMLGLLAQSRDVLISAK